MPDARSLLPMPDAPPMSMPEWLLLMTDAFCPSARRLTKFVGLVTVATRLAEILPIIIRITDKAASRAVRGKLGRHHLWGLRPHVFRTCEFVFFSSFDVREPS